MLGPDSFRGDDKHEAVELTRLAVELGVQWNDGKMAAARARVSAGVFISRGEGCRGERREGGSGCWNAKHGLCPARKAPGSLDGEGGPGGGVVAPVPSL